MELNFIKCGDYYIPDIRLEKPNIQLGRYGRRRKEYLQQFRPVLYSELILSEKLYEHCAEVDTAAQARMDVMLPQLMKLNGITEQLKAENQMKWVREMNACVSQIEEIINAELVYCN